MRGAVAAAVGVVGVVVVAAFPTPRLVPFDLAPRRFRCVHSWGRPLLPHPSPVPQSSLSVELPADPNGGATRHVGALCGTRWTAEANAARRPESSTGRALHAPPFSHWPLPTRVLSTNWFLSAVKLLGAWEKSIADIQLHHPPIGIHVCIQQRMPMCAVLGLPHRSAHDTLAFHMTEPLDLGAFSSSL